MVYKTLDICNPSDPHDGWACRLAWPPCLDNSWEGRRLQRQPGEDVAAEAGFGWAATTAQGGGDPNHRGNLGSRSATGPLPTQWARSSKRHDGRFHLWSDPGNWRLPVSSVVGMCVPCASPALRACSKDTGLRQKCGTETTQTGCMPDQFGPLQKLLRFGKWTWKSNHLVAAQDIPVKFPCLLNLPPTAWSGLPLPLDCPCLPHPGLVSDSTGKLLRRLWPNRDLLSNRGRN